MIEQLFSWIAPHHCQKCDAEGTMLCEKCATSLLRIEPSCYSCGKPGDWQTCAACQETTPLHTVFVLTSYEETAKQLLWNLKFGRAQAAAEPIATALAKAFGPELRDCLIVPVPTANNRVRQRGYDQAALIARSLAYRLRLPHARLLARVSSTRQVGSSRAERQQQMESAFRLLRPYMAQSQRIILVDDVLTTGSTLDSAARMLKQAGARNVSAVVFARAGH